METPHPQTIVCQIGARRHYAVPVALHQAGLLERLYTDFCMADPMLRGLRRVMPARLARGRLAKLFAREIDIPASKIRCLWRSTLGNSVRAVSQRRQPADVYARYLRQNIAFGNAVVRHGFGTADAVYGFNGAAVEIFQSAQEEGLRLILDQTIAPLRSMAALLEEERRRWPDWDLEPTERAESVAQMIEREQLEWELADVVVCGSQFVGQAIQEEGVPEHKVNVVRSGNQAAARKTPREPWMGRPLRVLIAGTVELRKGIQYAVEAARLLPKDRFEFRSVGSIRLTESATAKVREQIQLIGPVPRSEMQRHYEWADVLLHPSLAEGSANVCHEALAHGLPVIVTPNSGAAIEDGIQGFVVPIRDVEGIVARLLQVMDMIGPGARGVKSIDQASDASNYQSRLAAVLRGAAELRRDAVPSSPVHVLGST